MSDLIVRATGRFAQDLEDSAAYYLERTGKGGVLRFLDEYDKFCSLVSAFPGYGSPVGDTGLRWRRIGSFIAAYREDAEQGEVLLLRLYYLSSSWRKRAVGMSDDKEA